MAGPEVRAGLWASDTPQNAPAAQPWEADVPENEPPAQNPQPGAEITALSDEFNSNTLSPQWHFIHPDADNSYLLTGSAYEVQMQGPDENGDPQQVSILGESVPASGDWIVETKLTSSVPFSNSCCYNFAQGALFIYGNDQNSIKADVFPDFDTRQTEFGKQLGPVPTNWTKGGTWQHQLGSTAQIGISAENTAGFTVDFDYVRVYQLQ
jgi:arabinan endo-1,5-alpha-L-arabinosidase